MQYYDMSVLPGYSPSYMRYDGLITAPRVVQRALRMHLPSQCTPNFQTFIASVLFSKGRGYVGDDYHSFICTAESSLWVALPPPAPQCDGDNLESGVIWLNPA
jgi:hypothetical protein